MVSTYFHPFYDNGPLGLYLYSYTICPIDHHKTFFCHSCLAHSRKTFTQWWEHWCVHEACYRSIETLVAWCVGRQPQHFPEFTWKFKLRGCLMWTINDWPCYGLLSGMAHAGYAGCPPCGPEVTSRYSRELHKCLYISSRRSIKTTLVQISKL